MDNRRGFGTTYRSTDEPEWAPLEAVSAVVRCRPDLEHFHPGEFMWMCSVENRRKRLVIHLYKHVDTRLYLNLDEAGHAYEFRHDPCRVRTSDAQGTANSAGRYRRFHSLEEAVFAVGLWEFEVLGLHRTFPPAEWPPDRRTKRVDAAG